MTVLLDQLAPKGKLVLLVEMVLLDLKEKPVLLDLKEKLVPLDQLELLLN
jgi:hypothetical protein